MASTTEPPTAPDASVLNISASSESTVHLPAPTKKLKATPALGALVATSENVRLHTATQIAISSGSEISIISSAERQRRYDADRAKFELAERRLSKAQAECELAEARIAMNQSRDQLSAGSQAGSIGRLDDVRSEGGVSTRARRSTDSVASLPQGRSLTPSAAAPAVDPIPTTLRRCDL